MPGPRVAWPTPKTSEDRLPYADVKLFTSLERNANRSSPEARSQHSSERLSEAAPRWPPRSALNAKIGSSRIGRETTKREVVYADFIMSASKLLLKAHLSGGLTLGGDEQYLIGLANRMRLFAPPNVVGEAEAVIRGVIKISLEPSLDLRKLTMADLSKIQTRFASAI